MKPLRKGPGGFTLIEVTMAILVISVLASVALPRWGDSMRRSRGKACAATRHSVEVAEARYVSEVTGGSPSVGALYDGRYLENRPVCPAGGDYVWAGGAGVLANDRYVVCSIHGTARE